jgi:beta-glucanase (GH16 family)
MENIGQMDVVHAALHWSNYTVGPCPCYAHEQSNQNFSLPVAPGTPLFNETYTTFGVEWSKDAMVFYYNDTSYLTVSDPTAKFQQTAFYFIVNTAVGGSWPGFPDDTTVFPQYHKVDWVRHYAAKTST